jgi:hypothetical protein
MKRETKKKLQEDDEQISKNDTHKKIEEKPTKKQKP